MPTYEYRCKDCDHEFEVVQSFSDGAAHRVPVLRRRPPQGVRERGHHVQGQRLLQDRQPLRLEQREVRRDRQSDGDSSLEEGLVVVLVRRTARRARRRRTRARRVRRATRRPPRRAPPPAVAGAPADDRGLRRFRVLPSCSTTSPSTSVDTPFGPPVGRRARRPPRRRRRWPSSPATAPATSSRPTGSTSGPTSGRCKELGVTRIFGPCAVGSLRADIAPGDFVVLRPAGRPHLRTARHLLRRPGRQPRVASPTPTAPSCGRVAVAAVRGRGRHRARQRHDRRDPGPPLLDPGREPLVPAPPAGT